VEEYTVLPLGGPATGPPKVNDLFDIEEANFLEHFLFNFKDWFMLKGLGNLKLLIL